MKWVDAHPILPPGLSEAVFDQNISVLFGNYYMNLRRSWIVVCLLHCPQFGMDVLPTTLQFYSLSFKLWSIFLNVILNKYDLTILCSLESSGIIPDFFPSTKKQGFLPQRFRHWVKKRSNKIIKAVIWAKDLIWLPDSLFSLSCVHWNNFPFLFQPDFFFLYNLHLPSHK